MRNIAKLALRLMIFSLAAGVLLAGVNALTEKPIAENLARKQNAGRAAVIGEYDFAPMEFDAQAYPNIAALYEARDGETVVGYVYELSTTGYAGEVLLSLGVSTAGRITGIAVTAHTETKGLGSADEAPFLAQFTGAAAVPETAAGADAMTGATVSSNAVKTAVSCALSHCQDVLRLAASADAPQAEDAAVPLEALLERYGGAELDVFAQLGFEEIAAVVAYEDGYAFAMDGGDTVLLAADGTVVSGEGDAARRAREFFERYLKGGE